MLLDIEGATTPVHFVYQTLFPYARKHGPDYLREFWDSDSLRPVRNQLLKQNELDAAEGAPQISREPGVKAAIQYYEWLMDRDRKVTPLKTIQGLIWERGYTTGELHSEVYPDVPRAFSRWQEERRSIAIYSSGSVLAQQQLFRYTNYGDLTGFISSYFDTETGGKREMKSYSAIARSLGFAAADICFVSDTTEEIEAARVAGMKAVLCAREPRQANTPASPETIIGSFEELP
jgi:enolase-phosphatase E1